MKTFRAHTSFIPDSVANSFVRETPAVILPKTDYEVVDTNQAFGLYIKIKTPSLKDNTKSIVQQIYISPEEISKFGEVQNRLTAKELNEILNNISFAKSCIDFEWGWEVIEIHGQYWDAENPIAKGELVGFLINTTFKRPDTNTGIVGIGRGRRMWIEATASETSVVMTAWVCVDLIIKHEAMEAFKYENAKILNPHKTLEQLAYPDKMISQEIVSQ